MNDDDDGGGGGGGSDDDDDHDNGQEDAMSLFGNNARKSRRNRLFGLLTPSQLSKLSLCVESYHFHTLSIGQVSGTVIVSASSGHFRSLVKDRMRRSDGHSDEIASSNRWANL